jgi:hypothetical protein
MTNAIIAYLSSDSIASALNFTVRSPAPVLALCRRLNRVRCLRLVHPDRADPQAQHGAAIGVQRALESLNTSPRF